MFIENNIHTKIARNEMRASNVISKENLYPTLYRVEYFKYRGSGNRFFRRMNFMISAGRLCHTAAETKFLDDFVFINEFVLPF